jgi:hypothetical protein
MSSTSEKGHPKNVANFETIITFCIGYGAAYNSSNPNLAIQNIQAKWEEAKLKLKAVKDTKEPFNSVTGARQLLFKPLKPTATKVINSLTAQEAPTTVIKDARTIIRKITGKRAKELTTDTEQNKISVSQQSYDRLVDSFEELIVLAKAEPTYNPNENEIKIAKLEAFHQQLSEINTKVKNSYVPYSNALIARDQNLYTPETGLIDLALDIKNYIKSIFGASSPQYRQISSIEFSRPKDN